MPVYGFRLRLHSRPTLRVEDVAARLAVEDSVVRMFVAADERDWGTLVDCFTDPFTLDMTSMTGGSPASMTPTQVANAWSEGFKPLDHVHHQVGNFRTRVDGDRATVACYGMAFHHRAKAAGPMKTRLFVGSYELQLVAGDGKWRISEFRFKRKFIDGNLDLERSE